MPGSSRGRSPSPHRSRSVLSKLKAPFASKTRNIAEFYIQPDDPHRQYSPGDTITGSVVLKVVKPLRITHLVCCLHGYVQAYKTPNTPGESYRTYSAALASGKTRKSGGYYGNGFMSLFEDEVVLCGDGRLDESTYQFNFELVFPRERLPSSIEVSLSDTSGRSLLTKFYV
jgi:arrestin-related trafficking adapter 9